MCIVQPVVRIVDAGGRTVSSGSDASRFVTLTKASGNGSVGGNLIVATSAGIAEFTNIAISNETSNLVVTATCSSLSVGSRSTNSEAIIAGTGVSWSSASW